MAVRWWAGLAVVLLAATWLVMGSDEAGEMPAGIEPDVAEVGRPVILTRSAESTSQESAPAQPEGAPDVVRLSSEVPVTAPGRSEARGVLDRADALLAAGSRAEAVALLRDSLAGATPYEQGRMALRLAFLVPDGQDQRQLLSLALRQRAVLGAEYDEVGQNLRELNRSPGATLLDALATADYAVRPNDSLWKLCNSTLPEQYGVSPEVGLVRLMNGLGTSTLRVGQTLVVPQETLRIEIDREQHGLTAFLGDIALMCYRVGLGKENRTPRGEFVVRVKQEKPTWYRNGQAIPYGDPENILGTRWMGFENHPGAMGYGIHGTERPESIGLDESMGCVRMRNVDVEELFEIVPRGTVVAIP